MGWPPEIEHNKFKFFLVSLSNGHHIWRPTMQSLYFPFMAVSDMTRPSTKLCLAISCYDFPFLFHFTLLFDPLSILFHSDQTSLLFPCHLSTRLSSFPLSMTHKPWGLLLLLFLHCLTLPGTALWLTPTPFHLEAAPPLYFPSIWLVMTRPLSFTGLPFALPSTYKYPVG